MAKKNGSMTVSMVSEKDWMARDDAHTLARAEEIKRDKARMSAAAKVASEMATKASEEAKALKKVARKGK